MSQHEITVGSRVIRRDRPDFAAQLVSEARPSKSGDGFYVLMAGGGCHSRDLIVVPDDWQDCPPFHISFEAAAEAMYDDVEPIPAAVLAAVRRIDRSLPALAAKLTATEEHLAWANDHLARLGEAFEPRVSSANIAHAWALSRWIEAGGSQEAADLRVPALAAE
jgi:hypothetical protein